MTTSYANLDNDRAAQGAVISGVAGRPLGFSGRKENLLNAIDSATHEMREIAQRWQDRLTVDRHSIAENYANGRLSLICDLNILVPESGVDRNLRVDQRPLGDSEVFASAIFAVDRPNVRNVLLRYQEPVLVFDVECVKTPEGFSAPSLVRLYGIHDEVDDCFRGLLFQSAITGDYKIIPGVVDRELGVHGPNAQSRKLDIVHDEVEGAHKIVDHIPNDKQKTLRGSLIRADLKGAISGLSIILDQNTVRASVGELPRLSVKIVDVLVGPFDL